MNRSDPVQEYVVAAEPLGSSLTSSEQMLRAGLVFAFLALLGTEGWLLWNAWHLWG